MEKNDTFLIQGEASRLGRFVLEKNMTVLSTILEAGGVAKNGKYGTAVIRRKNQGESGAYKKIAESRINDGLIEKSEVEDLVLEPESILYVERIDTIVIQGGASRLGSFVVEKKMTVVR